MLGPSAALHPNHGAHLFVIFKSHAAVSALPMSAPVPAQILMRNCTPSVLLCMWHALSHHRIVTAKRAARYGGLACHEGLAPAAEIMALVNVSCGIYNG